MTDQLSLLPMLNELPEGKQGTFEALQESVRQTRKGDKVMNELKAIRSGEIYNIIEYEDCYRTDDLYYPKSEVDAAIEELKDDNRRLKRALWLARASEASKEVNYWTCQDESSYAIVDFNVRHETIVSYKAPHHRPYKWILIWENVERKCRAKAEEYK